MPELEWLPPSVRVPDFDGDYYSGDAPPPPTRAAVLLDAINMVLRNGVTVASLFGMLSEYEARRD